MIFKPKQQSKGKAKVLKRMHELWFNQKQRNGQNDHSAVYEL